MTCTYPSCETPTVPGIHLCAPHQAQYVTLLDRAPDQVATARETVAKLGSNVAGGGGATVASAPVNLTAMILVDEFVRLITAEPIHLGAEPTPIRVRRLALHSSSGPTLAHLERAEARMMAVSERPADWLILGDCAALDDDTPCAGRYRYQRGDVMARCSKCPFEVEIVEYRRWQLRRVPFAPARLTRLVRALEGLGVAVRLNTVQVWAHRGRLVPCEFDTAGKPLYRVGDVLDILEAKPVPA